MIAVVATISTGHNLDTQTFTSVRQQIGTIYHLGPKRYGMGKGQVLNDLWRSEIDLEGWGECTSILREHFHYLKHFFPDAEFIFVP